MIIGYNPSEWDTFLTNFPNAHLLQTSLWGELKGAFGWEVTHIVTGETGAQILIRRLPFGYTLAYIPKGPLGEDWSRLWPMVDDLCRQRRSIFLKIEPDLWKKEENSQIHAPPTGFRLSSHSIQPLQTLVVDLLSEEEQILGLMKQKTRYNIKLAQKKGVTIRPCPDIEMFHDLMQITGERDQFGVHNLKYYRRAYDLFHPHGACEMLLGEYEGEPLAGVMVFSHGQRAWYLYGASSNRHRERMPNYLLQWEAMRWARNKGCSEYDLWGVPDVDLEILEAEFTHRDEGLWGVYRFKRGFGGTLRRAAGPWDRVYKPVLYTFYRWWMKRGNGEG